MPIVTVEIEVDTDAGTFKVGLEPPDADDGAEAQAAELLGGGAQESEGAEDSYMKPVRSLDEALQVAKDMLSGQTGAQAQEASADDQMAQGFGKPAQPTMMGRA